MPPNRQNPISHPPEFQSIMIARDWAVAILVVREQRVLLHWHERLQRWLPPGGHIEPNELPDDAAVREVMEETGVGITLVGDGLNPIASPNQPRQLVRPLGIQLADIREDHQHIDLVYLAAGLTEGDGRGQWFDASGLAHLPLTPEVAEWCRTALEMTRT
jgi:8-oxo-dGTP pyrophosphatase MutT (NUDIX family)